MPKIPEKYAIGSRENLSVDQLLVILEDMYTDLAVAINRKPEIYERTTDGQTSDTVLSNGDININSSTLKVEMLTEHATPSTVTWTQLN